VSNVWNWDIVLCVPLLTFALSDLSGDPASVLGRQAFALITEQEQLQETEQERERELNLYSISMNCSSWCYLGFQWWEVQIIPSKRTMALHLLTSLANYTPQNMSPLILLLLKLKACPPVSLSLTHANFVIFLSLSAFLHLWCLLTLYCALRSARLKCEHKSTCTWVWFSYCSDNVAHYHGHGLLLW